MKKTPPNEKTLNGRTLLVLGGAGFIGSNFIRYIFSKHPRARVINFDKLTYSGNRDNNHDIAKNSKLDYQFVKRDIASKNHVNSIFKKYQPEYVINFAAESITERTYLPLRTSLGTTMLTFGEMWERQRKRHTVKKTEHGEVMFLNSYNHNVKVLSFLNGGQWMPLRAITRHWYKGKIIRLIQKHGIIEATPNHSIYASNLELKNPTDNPEILVLRNVNENNKKYGTASKNLLRFLAAFITEGSTTFNKANGSYITEISQANKQWLERIASDGKKIFGAKGNVAKNRSVYRLQFSNKKLFHYLQKECGKYACNKQIPSFIFDLDPNLREFFWKKLLEGDGTPDGRYTTVSPKLASQIGLLLTFQNVSYAVHERKFKNKKWKTAYSFRTKKPSHYGLNGKKQEVVDYEGWVYDLEVDFSHNFVCGIGNVVCHNTHVDRSIHGASLEFIKTNIEGVFNILEAVKSQKQVRKYVQVSCYDELTKTHTRNGLKNYWELKNGDEVLTLNVKTSAAEWQKIEKIIVQDYRGKMVRMSNGKIDLLVTPNHRMLDRSMNFLEASQAMKGLYFPCASLKNNLGNEKIVFDEIGEVNTKELFYLIGVFLGDGFTAYQERLTKNKSGLSRKDFIARRDNKGHFVSKKEGPIENIVSKSWRIFFDIPEKDKARKKTEQALTNLGIQWSAQKGKSGEHLYFTSEAWLKFFDRCCGKGAYEKKIPYFAFAHGHENLSSLLDGMIDSDGHRRKNGVCSYTTVSEKLKDGAVSMAVILGKSVSVRKTFSECFFNGRKISGSAYSILIGKGKENKSIHRDSINYADYRGKVWCIKVKNKNFLVERNGKYNFCGNTDEVYGSLSLDSKEKFREDTAFAPNVPYAATKAGGDLLCRAYHSTWKVPVVVTHCSNNYGPYQYPEKIIPYFVSRMLEGKKLPLYGDGRHVRDWIFVLDHCRALELCLLRGRLGEVYNIGANNEMDNTDIAKKILRHFKRDESWLEFVGDRPGHDRRYAIHSSKIRKELGWKPKFTFEKAFKETVQWYIDNPKWIARVRKRTGVFNPHIDLWKAHHPSSLEKLNNLPTKAKRNL